MDEKETQLLELRKSIDQIDSQIIKALNRRMEMALQTRKLKDEVMDGNREKEILESAKRKSHGPLEPQFTEKIFREIMSESKKLQAKKTVLIGFQGEHGAYGEMAIRAYSEEAMSIPCKEFVDVFEGVKNGQLDLGVVPVENSIAGSVLAVNDLLVETNLQVIGEIKVPIHHCLLTLPEADYRDIKIAYSHPQALAQCRGFISRNKLDAKPYYDTAGAAMMISNEKPAASAAIASKLCAEIYGLEILKENIEDHESNSTRFLVISKTPNKEKGDKCSVVFSTSHKAGSLFRVLGAFSESNVNLTRIESRPVLSDPGKYAFLVDFQGCAEDEKVKKAIEKAKHETAMFKMLGCYKEAKS
ncbi:prephenate dehydratase [Candidatus Micrarchaeota archaeon]|nr:prephenate dehydratase [Candidatus Micrarchaeota archaeon]